VVSPPGVRAGIRGWSRANAYQYLESVLRPGEPRTIVAIDFGFGLPWGADTAIFNCTGWRKMIDCIECLYSQHRTARATGQTINSYPQFQGHGPFRFNDGRSDARFYLDRGVAYYRLVEVAIPQAISQWYMGSGGAVGFHTISGLSALSRLLAQRDSGKLTFAVWPQEGLQMPTEKHLVVESYPAICPRLEDYGPCVDDDQRDAWQVLQWLLSQQNAGNLPHLFSILSKPYGRHDGASFKQQIEFEGWIVGVQ